MRLTKVIIPKAINSQENLLYRAKPTFFVTLRKIPKINIKIESANPAIVLFIS